MTDVIDHIYRILQGEYESRLRLASDTDGEQQMWHEGFAAGLERALRELDEEMVA